MAIRHARTPATRAVKTAGIDESAREFSTIFVSAGQRGLELELTPDDLAKLCRAAFAELVPPETGG